MLHLILKAELHFKKKNALLRSIVREAPGNKPNDEKKILFCFLKDLMKIFWTLLMTVFIRLSRRVTVISMWRCPERIWSRCLNRKVSQYMPSCHYFCCRTSFCFQEWIHKIVLFYLKDFCMTRTFNTHNRSAINRKRRSMMTSWPPVGPLNSPGMPFSVAGPHSQSWTPTPWPFPGGRPYSSTPCPLPFWRG